jgi:hypothetical protein
MIREKHILGVVSPCLPGGLCSSARILGAKKADHVGSHTVNNMINHEVGGFTGKHDLVKAPVCLDLTESMPSDPASVEVKVPSHGVTPAFPRNYAGSLDGRSAAQSSSRVGGNTAVRAITRVQASCKPMNSPKQEVWGTLARTSAPTAAYVPQ